MLIENSIERLPVDKFNFLVQVLNEKRGDFLLECSEHMAQLLCLFSTKEPCRRYALEGIEVEHVKQEPFDSPRLIEYLGLE